MIKLVKEPAVFFKKTKVYEQCYFCKKETNTWHDKSNTPVCKYCAEIYKVEDINNMEVKIRHDFDYKNLKLSISDSNALIAEFMGFKKYLDTNAFIKDDSVKLVLNYNKNWDELMDVVEKIESFKVNTYDSYGKFYVTISQHSCRVHTLLDSSTISKSTGFSKIQAVFEAVVGFIIWYNQNKNVI